MRKEIKRDPFVTFSQWNAVFIVVLGHTFSVSNHISSREHRPFLTIRNKEKEKSASTQVAPTRNLTQLPSTMGSLRQRSLPKKRASFSIRTRRLPINVLFPLVSCLYQWHTLSTSKKSFDESKQDHSFSYSYD